MRSLLVLGAVSAAAIAAASAAPERWRPFVENKSRFDLTKVKLTQLHPDSPAWIVTSSGGGAFDKATLQNGDDGPWRLRAEFQCPEGGGSISTGELMQWPGELRVLRLETVEKIDLAADWFSGDELPGTDESAGAYEADIWTGSDFSQSHKKLDEDFALAACNAALAKVKAANPNMSDKVAMSRVGVIHPYWTQAGAERKTASVALEGICAQQVSGETPNGVRWIEEIAARGETDPLKLRLPVVCKSPLSRPGSASNALTAGFAVTEATLVANPVFSKGECPRTVKFRGSFLASGAGEVRYRLRGSDGSLGPINTLQVDSSRRAVFDFAREFGKKPSGGLTTGPSGSGGAPGSVTTPTSPPDPKGPQFKAPSGGGGAGGQAAGAGSVAVATAEGEHSGWMRVEILSPAGGVRASREAPYKVICETPPAAPKGLAARPRREQ
jgi:hypothetical protein